MTSFQSSVEPVQFERATPPYAPNSGRRIPSSAVHWIGAKLQQQRAAAPPAVVSGTICCYVQVKNSCKPLRAHLRLGLVVGSVGGAGQL